MSSPHPSRSSGDSGAGRLRDARLAAEIAIRLAWDAWVPKDAVRVRVEHGWVTLQGELTRERDKTAVMEDVSRLFGVAGVTDRTTVKLS